MARRGRRSPALEKAPASEGGRYRELLLGGGEAVVADAADFGAGDGYLHFEVAGDLFLELFVEAGFEFADLAAAETGDVNVVAGAVGFVVVAIAAEMEKIELVDETFFFEQVDGAIDGDEMDGGIDFLGAREDLVDVEVLLGSVHDFQDDATLASEANSLFTQSLLEMAGGIGGVDTFAGRDAMGGGGSHCKGSLTELNGLDKRGEEREKMMRRRRGAEIGGEEGDSTTESTEGWEAFEDCGTKTRWLNPSAILVG